MEIIKSNKNTNKLCFEGYMYVIECTGKDKITWRCDNSSTLKCPGSIYTDIAQSKILELGHPHLITHPANHNYLLFFSLAYFPVAFFSLDFFSLDFFS